jgi:hypothetical protein
MPPNERYRYCPVDDSANIVHGLGFQPAEATPVVMLVGFAKTEDADLHHVIDFEARSSHLVNHARRHRQNNRA